MSELTRLCNVTRETEAKVNELTKIKKTKRKKEKNENYEMGTPENTKSKLDATPGQSVLMIGNNK